MSGAGAERPTLRARLLRARVFAEALDREVDLSALRGRPSARLVWGLLLIGLSYVIGWPAMTVFCAVSLWLGRPKWVLVGPPVLYAFSWVVFTIGLWLAGPASLVRLRAVTHWGLRRFAERFLVR